MQRVIALVLVVLVAIGAVGLYLQSRQAAPAQRQTLATPAPLTSSATPGQPIRRNEPTPADGSVPTRIPVPLALDGSDEETRTAAHSLAPTLLKWLTPEEQLRKWVALVDAIADGKLPEKHLPLNYPMPGFSVLLRDDVAYANAVNHHRADVLIETITAIPPRKLAEYYHAYSALLEQAYAELGRGGTFEARLMLAIQKVRDVKPLMAEAPLARPKFYYTYADPALESSSDIAKLLWRLGPANQRQLQVYLGELQPML